MSKVDAPDVEPTAAPEKAPVKKPARPRGRYIDFAPRRTPKNPSPAPKVTVVVRPAATRPASRPSPKSSRPVIDESLTVGDILDTVAPEPEFPAEEALPVEEETLSAEVDEPAFAEEDDGPLAEFNHFEDEEDETTVALSGFADDESIDVEAQEEFLSGDDSDNYVEEVLSQVSETRTETTVRRSPFLKNYKIEKRPLSSRAPVREQLPSAEALPPTPRKEYREEEFARRADSVPENAEEPIRTPEEKTGSRLGMVITIIITILLGAGVGVFVYLAFFQ